MIDWAHKYLICQTNICLKVPRACQQKRYEQVIRNLKLKKKNNKNLPL